MNAATIQQFAQVAARPALTVHQTDTRQPGDAGKTITTEKARFLNMPADSDRPQLAGLTLRQTVRALRGVIWGDMGAAVIDLSDGSWLIVRNQPASDGGELLGTQIAVRYHEIRGRQVCGRKYFLRELKYLG